MIWVMVVAKTMCHVVRKRAVTQSCQLIVFSVSEAGCWSRGPGESRSYGSLYDRDVLLAAAISGGKIRDSLSRVGLDVAVEDLLNFAVARTHLLKMMTPELQAIQTLHRHQINQYRSPRVCRARHCGHFQRRRHRTPLPHQGGCCVGRIAGLWYVRDVDGRVKAAGLGRRRGGFLSEDTALELPLLLARVPLVFLCCRHGGRFRSTSRDETRRACRDGDGGRD